MRGIFRKNRNLQTSETTYAWLPQRSSEILQCVIVSSVVNDCVVLSQYDLHHGSFLLVTPIITSRYKCTIIHCKSTSLRWRAVLSKLCFSRCKFFRYYLTSKLCIKFIWLVFILRSTVRNHLFSPFYENYSSRGVKKHCFMRRSPVISLCTVISTA